MADCDCSPSCGPSHSAKSCYALHGIPESPGVPGPSVLVQKSAGYWVQRWDGSGFQLVDACDAIPAACLAPSSGGSEPPPWSSGSEPPGSPGEFAADAAQGFRDFFPVFLSVFAAWVVVKLISFAK